ncbi:MAG: cellulase family glycosylhydrolase [Deltaproteobacteria bacterium]|nr:cellulase family glycosylhydrolase [Deltaproteobacteria bacterium]
MRKILIYTVLSIVISSCLDSERQPIKKLSRPRVDRTYFRDAYNRYVYFNGINVGGTNKLPVRPIPSADPRGQPVTFVGRPFPLSDADKWFSMLRDLGFNSIRLVINWEAVEHEGPGKFDYEFLNYIREIVKKANEYNIYVLVNFHENLFSRILFVNFNRNPSFGEVGSFEYMLASVFPDEAELDRGRVKFDSRTMGDGAPMWAVKACLPEKKLDSKKWGVFKLLGNLGDAFMRDQIINNIDSLLGGLDIFGPAPTQEERDLSKWLRDMILKMQNNLKEPLIPFDITETTDVFPFTNWWNNTLFSYDINRCYAAFFAGDKVFPKYEYEYPDLSDPSGKRMIKMNVKDYLQTGYINSWIKVVEAVKDLPNIIGYDLINEPPGGFLMLTLMSAYFSSEFNPQSVKEFLSNMVGEEKAEALYRLIFLLNILPLFPTDSYFEDRYANAHKSDIYKYANEHQSEYQNWLSQNEEKYKDKTKDMTEDEKTSFLETRFYIDTHKEEIEREKDEYKKMLRKQYSADDIDMFAVLDLNVNFVIYLVDLYRKIGTAIQKVDPDAIIWLEEGGGALDSLLGETIGTVNLYKPEELKQVVFTPHWYPDIYPFLGINSPPREFTVEEWRVQDFTPYIKEKVEAVKSTFGLMPTVFGEFGTYFNYNGIENSKNSNYRISAEILDNYYEAFESLFIGRMLWCFSADNTYEKGDLWNYEDFSIIDPNGRPRAELAFSRPYPKFLSGKPLKMHFYSDYHYYDSSKGIPDPWREFYMAMESKESDMPTEIFIPSVQYKDGFYIWLSDGWGMFDKESSTFFWYPTADEPGIKHEITIRPLQEKREYVDWTYFYKDGKLMVGKRN